MYRDAYDPAWIYPSDEPPSDAHVCECSLCGEFEYESRVVETMFYKDAVFCSTECRDQFEDKLDKCCQCDKVVGDKAFIKEDKDFCNDNCYVRWSIQRLFEEFNELHKDDYVKSTST